MLKSLRLRASHRLPATLALLFSALTANGQQPEQSQKTNSPSSAKQIYQQLVEKVKSGDLTVDFVELIAAASDWDLSEQSVVTAPNRDEMAEAFKKKDYRKATELVEGVLDYEFTNRGLHRAAANAYQKLSNDARAEFHRVVAEKIFNALLSTGDGRSPQTAYCVQGISEEYLIMEHFGYKVNSQTYLTSGDSDYDMLSGIDPKSKKPVELYFDISGHFRRCLKSHLKDKN